VTTEEENAHLRQQLAEAKETRMRSMEVAIENLGHKIEKKFSDEDATLLRMKTQLAELGQEMTCVHKIADDGAKTARGVGASLDAHVQEFDRRMDKLELSISEGRLGEEKRKALERFITKEKSYDELVADRKGIVKWVAGGIGAFALLLAAWAVRQGAIG
jgi:asparagine synthetase B (glutamine-hydrolysing)